MKHPNLKCLLTLVATAGLAVTCALGAWAKAPQKSQIRQKQPLKVACIGNSITFGYTLADPATQSYPSLLQGMLGPGYDVKNFGRSGATLLNKGHRPYMRTEEWQAAKAFVPDLAVIHLGINDTDPRDWPLYGDDFARDYLSLIDTLRMLNPDVRVIMAKMTPLSADHYRYESGTRQWHEEEQQMIEGIAKQANVELIDLFTPFSGRMELLHDAIHPNEEGAQILAETVYGGITGDYGGLKMPIAYTSGMVLPREKPLRISGTANAGQTVTVTLAPKAKKGNRMAPNQAKAVADNLGKWSVELAPEPAGVDYVLTVTDGPTTLTYDDVAIGEVWMASGQSNMEFQLRRDLEAAEGLAAADDSLLRLFDMKTPYYPTSILWDSVGQREVNLRHYYKPTSWQRSTPDVAKEFSAVAYFFAKALRDSLQVPVGVICNAIGGSTAQAWVSYDRLAGVLPGAVRKPHHNDYPLPWCNNRAKENLGENFDNPLQKHSYDPAYLYEAGVVPLGAYPIDGVIWYQGESNEDKVFLHEQIFPLVVEEMRDNWDNDSLPFYFAQLSSLSRPSWPSFRDSQRRLAEQIPNCRMVVTSDHGDSLDVHPRWKRPVGQRMARWALHDLYGHSGLVPSGPAVKGASIDGQDVVVSFDYADGLTTSDGRAPITFEVAEIDGFYSPATATIEGDKVRLVSPDVAHPRYVRYGYQPFTRANLVNRASLPASTFKIEVEKK